MRTLSAALLLCVGVAGAQQMGDLQGGAEKPKATQWLRYDAEPQTVAAGRPAMVEVHLQVRDGFHVNSHTPKSDLQIATTVAVKAADAGVTVGALQYPAGETYRFAEDPTQVLDVYTGAVVVRVPVTAAKGEHVLSGSVRYQACDDRSCFPPRTVAIEVPFTAR